MSIECQVFSERMRGQVIIQSQLGISSTFILTLQGWAKWKQNYDNTYSSS
jgi:hypothetical protein